MINNRLGVAAICNIVEKVSLDDTVLVNYTYLADGTKVSALDAEGDGLLYLGSLIYRKQGETISLESAGFAGGRFVAKESVMVPMFHVTDHLGSVRAVVDGVSREVVETNDYYPFGSRWNTTSDLMDETNRFRYNSKEEQFKFGTPYIDYGARQYDPVLGRWFAQDPLSEKYYSVSPYAFCAGNPVKYLDPDGEIIGTAIDVASVAIGIGSFIKNVRSGNVKEAVGDAVGVAVDVVAAAMPFIPGGVGLVRNGAKTAKVINAIDNAADLGKAAENVADVGKDAVKAADELTSGVSKKSIVISPENQVDRNLLEKPAKRGNAFIFKDDKTPVEIHHMGQNNNGPYKEMHRSNHRGKDNYKKNHPQSNEKSRINREEFAKQKREYWQNEYDKFYNY